MHQVAFIYTVIILYFTLSEIDTSSDFVFRKKTKVKRQNPIDAAASQFMRAQIRCGAFVVASQVYELESPPKELSMFYHMCMDPMAYGQCFIGRVAAPLLLKNFTSAAVGFCEALLPDVTTYDHPNQKQTLKCMGRLGKIFTACLRNNTNATGFIKNLMSPTHTIQDIKDPCETTLGFLQCTVENLKNCSNGTLPFARYYMAWVGGDCLVRNKVLNSLLTERVCNLASRCRFGSWPEFAFITGFVGVLGYSWDWLILMA